jgi:hypothetical protein
MYGAVATFPTMANIGASMYKTSDENLSGGKNMVKKLALIAVVALAGVLAAPAHADTLTAQETGGTAPFTVVNYGTAVSSGYQGAIPTEDGEVAVVTTAGSSQTGTPGEYPSGLYAGGTLDVSSSPFGGGLADYIVVQPNGEVTVTFSSPQTSLDLLWGSVDYGTTVNNTLTVTVDGTSYTGQSVDNYLVSQGDTVQEGVTDAYVEITGLPPGATTFTFQDTGSTSAFEFALGVPVAESGTLGMLGVALIGLIALVGFRRRSMVSC